jgi:glycosyltransferase involved in cell wall biosynthesis
MKNKKPIVLIVGPVTSNGGISQVINAIADQKCILDHYEIIKINTSQYKDSGLLGELITFITGLYKYILSIIFLKPKIIHIHTSANISFYRKSIFGFIGFLFKKNVIYHIHSSDFYQFFCNPSNRVIEKLILAILHRSKKIICLCNDWKLSLSEKYNLNNSIVITNPVNISSFQKQKKDEKSKKIKKILFMGFYIESKGIIDLLETFKKIYKKIDKIELYLCGKGELNEYINDFIEKNGLHTKITNVGWVSDSKKDYYYQNADILVLPSYKEGVPIAILEAFSYGLPVISTNISGIPEIIKNRRNGFIIEPGDRIDMGNRIEELINSPDLLRSIKINNLEQVKLHHPGKIAEMWENLYNELMIEN